MSPVHVREKPPLRHMIDVQAPAGRHYRLADDEPDPANVPSGLRYGDTMPGGFETADCTLPREPGVEYPDLERLSGWRVLGVGGELYWQGRLERAPRTSGDEVSVSPSAAGHQAALDDNKSVKELYVDRDLQHFVAPISRARQLALINGPPIRAVNGSSVEVAQDASGGLPAVKIGQSRIVNTAGTGPLETGETWYDANGVALDRIYYAVETREPGGAVGGAWVACAFLASTDDASTFDSGSNLIAGGAEYLVATVSTRIYALFQFYYNGTFTGDGTWTAFWKQCAAYGRHGLTRRGSDPGGFYASDVVGHAVARWAPQLTIKPDSIQQSGFVIPHLVFLEPTTCSEIVRQASRFSLPDWAVWDDKEFVWHQPGARGRTWRLRIGPSQLEETGPQADRVWESVIVQYQDVDGTTRTVGPPGSGADTESSDLKDLDPDNPANKLGITRRDILTMGVSTAAGATEVGRLFLEQSRLLDRSGKARVVGWAEDDRGVTHPFAAIRSGDYAVFVDAADTSARKIVRTDKSYDDRTCTLDLDAPPEGLQQLLERLGVVLVPLGL